MKVLLTRSRRCARPASPGDPAPAAPILPQAWRGLPASPAGFTSSGSSQPVLGAGTHLWPSAGWEGPQPMLRAARPRRPPKRPAPQRLCLSHRPHLQAPQEALGPWAVAGTCCHNKPSHGNRGTRAVMGLLQPKTGRSEAAESQLGCKRQPGPEPSGGDGGGRCWPR